MIKLTTSVSIPESVLKVTYKTPCLMIGSCFTDSIGERMNRYKLPVLHNPFGVLYNPSSVASALRTLMSNRQYTAEDLIQHNGLWISLDHHTSFSHPDRNKCLAGINESLQQAMGQLIKSRYLMITMGTAWIYTFKDTGKIVANCHKIPQERFEYHMLELEETILNMKSLMLELRDFNREIQVIFTVSPIRYMKSGAFNNQVSKSILILTVHALMKLFDFVQYFPAYEIFMDELRDYRFYSEDMFHPSETGIDYIWEKYVEVYMDKATQETMKSIMKIQKSINHRPFRAYSPAYQSFVENILAQIEELKKVNPALDFQDEKYQLRSRIGYYTNKS